MISYQKKRHLGDEGQDMKIGFIGLGNMGYPMAHNLAKAGHDVTGFDIISVTTETVTIASDAKSAVQEAEIIILMLNHADIVRHVLTDILPVLSADSLVIDCSTIDVKSARSSALMCADHQLAYLDAPVSGGVAAATAGTLTFMIGGSQEALMRGNPLFEIMGQKIVHCGESGAGQAAKICNNMILGITMIGTCEAFALADALGLSRASLYDVVSGASGQSWSMTSYCPAPDVGPTSPADNDYKPGFSADLMLKDLRLSQIAADSSGLHTQMGALATELYRRFVEDSDGSGQDFSAMLPHITNQS